MAHVYTTLAEYQASLPFGVVEETWADCVAECDAAGMNPKKVWGYEGVLGAGFSMSRLPESPRYTLLVLKEVRESLSLEELDAVLAHEASHYLNADLSDGVFREKKSYRRRLMEETRADAAAASGETMYRSLVRLAAVTDMVVNERKERHAAITAKMVLWLHPDLFPRCVLMKVRSWFGR